MAVETEKSAMRKTIRRLRRELTDRTERSERIARRLFDSDWYQDSLSVLIYVDMEGEVSTRKIFRRLLDDGRRIAVPYCDGPTLRCYWCKDLLELVPGTWGILEPPAEIREKEDRQTSAGDFDLIITPGVAFDRSGARLGQGGGYYDRFLAEVRRVNPKTAVVALAFDCQLVDQVPTSPSDIPIDGIVTETATYRCRPR